MEQNPIPGQDALAPPNADVARRFLAAADTVAQRRDRAVDRRALAWLQIAGAVVTAGYLVGFTLVLRQGDVVASQIVLFTFLVWGQLSSGMAQRNGMQWHLTRSRWPVVLGGGVILVGAVVVFGLVALDAEVPIGIVLVPAGMVLLGIGGYGVLQLFRASGDPRRPGPAWVPLRGTRRWGTVLVGAALGVLTMLAGAPDDMIRSVIMLLVMMALLAWIVAFNTDVGLPAVGASWRWPQIVAYFIATCGPVGLVLADGAVGERGLVGILVGTGVIALFVAVSFIPGREARG